MIDLGKLLKGRLACSSRLALEEDPGLILLRHRRCKSAGREGASGIPSQSWCAWIQHAAGFSSPCASANQPFSHCKSPLRAVRAGGPLPDHPRQEGAGPEILTWVTQVMLPGSPVTARDLRSTQPKPKANPKPAPSPRHSRPNHAYPELIPLPGMPAAAGRDRR